MGARSASGCTAAAEISPGGGRTARSRGRPSRSSPSRGRGSRRSRARSRRGSSRGSTPTGSVTPIRVRTASTRPVTLHDERHQRAAGDELDEPGEERLALVLAVVLGGGLDVQGAQLGGDEGQPLALEPADDLTDQSATNAVGLDEDEGALGHAGAPWSGGRGERSSSEGRGSSAGAGPLREPVGPDRGEREPDDVHRPGDDAAEHDQHLGRGAEQLAARLAQPAAARMSSTTSAAR